LKFVSNGHLPAQVRNAEKWGAVGVILFPDPAHVHPSKVPKHTPENWWLPGWAARSDSVRPPSFGDPLTPEFPSIGKLFFMQFVTLLNNVYEI